MSGNRAVTMFLADPGEQNAIALLLRPSGQ
jgi:hypothetical protein